MAVIHWEGIPNDSTFLRGGRKKRKRSFISPVKNNEGQAVASKTLPVDSGCYFYLLALKIFQALVI